MGDPFCARVARGGAWIQFPRGESRETVHQQSAVEMEQQLLQERRQVQERDGKFFYCEVCAKSVLKMNPDESAAALLRFSLIGNDKAGVHSYCFPYPFLHMED
jgi:hypothetical protein